LLKLGPQIGVQPLFKLAQHLRLGGVGQPRQLAIDVEIPVERVERVVTGLLRLVQALSGQMMTARTAGSGST